MKNQILSQKDLVYLASMDNYAEGSREVDEFMNQIRSNIKRIFPDSYIDVDCQDPSKTKYAILEIQFALGKDKSQWDSGYILNDPLHHRIWINGINPDGSLQDKLQMRVAVGNRLYLDGGSRSIKLGFKNRSAAPKNIIKALDNYFHKMNSILKEHKDEL